MTDIVDDFLQRLVATVPGVSSEALAQIERQTRQQWGGTHPYVRQRPRETTKNVLAQALREGRPLKECFATAGVSRASGYRILGRK